MTHKTEATCTEPCEASLKHPTGKVQTARAATTKSLNNILGKSLSDRKGPKPIRFNISPTMRRLASQKDEVQHLLFKTSTLDYSKKTNENSNTKKYCKKTDVKPTRSTSPCTSAFCKLLAPFWGYVQYVLYWDPNSWRSPRRIWKSEQETGVLQNEGSFCSAVCRGLGFRVHKGSSHVCKLPSSTRLNSSISPDGP